MTASLLNLDYKLLTDVYIKDYQGNIRAVYNQDDDCIVQQTDYYPYGLPKATSTEPAVNPFKYGGKELNTHLPQPFYDFVARMQLPQLCLFQRPDPMASDYTWLNPFTYCAGNPVNYVDPTGLVIEFADSTNTEFINAFHDAVQYLRENGASQWVDNIINSEKTYIIEYAASSFSETSITATGDELKEVRIKWAHDIVIETWSASYLSPAESLSHECDHAYRAEKDLKGLVEDQSIIIPWYGNKEDLRVIRGSERYVAKKLGKLGGIKYGRFSHDGKNFYPAIGIRGDFQTELLCYPK